MKIARFLANGSTLYGIIEGDLIRALLGLPWETLEPDGREFERADVRLLAPVAPPDIIAIGLNYRAHADEFGDEYPKAPVIFLKATSALAGPDDEIILPAMAPDEVDYEAELVIVIGKPCHNVAPEDALSYVIGYTCGNDVSARDCQIRLDKQWARGKSFDTFCPLGPWIETEIDPDNCRISSTLNGQVMQDSTTSDLIFSCSELISYCSQIATLRPGTVIMTGTPSGVGFKRTPPVFLRAGDTISISIDGIGTLTNTVIAE